VTWPEPVSGGVGGLGLGARASWEDGEPVSGQRGGGGSPSSAARGGARSAEGGSRWGAGEVAKTRAAVDGEVLQAAAILNEAVEGLDGGRSSLPTSSHPRRKREWRTADGLGCLLMATCCSRTALSGDSWRCTADHAGGLKQRRDDVPSRVVDGVRCR
jgi:hypothetical protein